MKSFDYFENTKIYSIPDSLKNGSGQLVDVLKIIAQTYDIDFEILEGVSFRIFGSLEQIQIADDVIEQVLARMARGDAADVDRLAFAGTVDDFLNSREPASNTQQGDEYIGGEDDNRPSDQIELILAQEDAAETEIEEKEGVKKSGSKPQAQVEEGQELEDLSSNRKSDAVLSSGSSFQKPTLYSEPFFNGSDVVSSKSTFNEDRGISDDVVRFNPNTSSTPQSPIVVIPNTPPVAVDDFIFVNEGEIVSIYSTLLLNDLDTDVLSIISLNAIGLTGLITFDPSGRSLTYEAGAYFNSFAAGETFTEFFLYTIADGRGGEYTAKVTVTITGVNDEPIAQDDVALIADDVTVITGNVMADNGNGADSDVDTSDVLIISAVSGGSVGSATAGSAGGLFTINSDGSYTFNPNGDFTYLAAGETEDTTITYTLDDGNGGADTATLTVTVTGVGDAPVAQDDALTTDEDTPYTGSVFVDNGNGADRDADATNTITVSAVAGGSVGSAAAGSAGGLFTINSDGSMTFDPNGDFDYLAVGETQNTNVTYTVSDGHGGTDTATVTVTVTGVNDAFTGNTDNVTINENATQNLHATLLANDVDIDTNDVLNIIAVDTSATIGAILYNDTLNLLSYSAVNFDYLALGETATDSFVYTVTDGHGGTQEVTVNITVNGVNDGPVAQDDVGTVDENSIYTANVLSDNGNGADSDIDTSDVLTVLGVTGGAARPGSAGGIFTINSDGSMTFNTNGAFESLAVGETRDTSVTYTVSDGHGGTDTATVTITVTGVNDAPVGNTDTITIDENVISDNLHTLLLSNDRDIDTSDVLNIIAVNTSATTGYVTFNDAANILTYNALNFDYLAEGETATDSFIYTVSDGNGGTSNVTVNVTVTGVNDNPDAREDLLTTNEDTVYNGNVLVDNGNGADSDRDTGDTVTVSGVVGGSLGVAIAGSAGGLFTVQADGSLIFDPNGDFESLAVGETAQTILYYTATDGYGGESIGTVTMTVTGVNDNPTAQDDAFATSEDAVLIGNVLNDNGNGADSDVDTSDTLSVTAVAGGALGAAVAGSAGGLFTINADGSLTFDPNGDFVSLAIGETRDTSITYTVIDGNGGTDTATATVTVTGINDAPTAQDDEITINADTTFDGSVLADNGNGADSDPDVNDILTVTAVAGGALGAAVAGSTGGLFTINADGTFHFDPNGEFDHLAVDQTQDTTITYTISDGNGGTDTATITMTVTGGSIVAEDDGMYGELAENGHTIIISEADLMANDTDVVGLTIDIVAMSADPGQGSLIDNGDGTWTYTSPADSLGFLGEANITYTLEDNIGATDTATFQLRVFNTITGTAGNDTLVAENNDVPHKFIGLAGNDTITGSNVRDLLIGGADNDVMFGGSGDDDFIFEGAGNGVDTVDGGDGTDRIIGSSGDDVFSVFSFTNIEEINMGAGTDTLLGTTGDDVITFGTTLITNLEQIDGNGGNDIISGTTGNDNYDLSNITSISNIAYIDMGAGDDTLRGSKGADNILISAGNNTLSGDDGDDTFLLSASATGANTINGGAGYDRIIGTAGNDFLILSSITSIEYIDMGAGDNYLMAEIDGTLDISAYTLGVDLIGLQYITDNIGTESLTGTNQDDEIRLKSDANADTFYGLDGDDTFRFAGAVNGGDIVDGGAGYDQLLGTAGNDSLTLSTITSIEFIDMGAGTDYMRAYIDGVLDLSAYTLGIDLIGLEYISDHSGTETITGTNQGDEIRLQSDDNADAFYGLDGDDIFRFSGDVEGGDIVDGGAGYDQLLGTAGNDSLTLSTLTGIEFIDMGAGTDFIQTSINGTIDLSSFTLGVSLLGLEYITDNTGTESLTGTNQGDEIHMQSDTAADTFNGLDGDDTFRFTGAVNRNDNIDGGDGNDQILGSSSDDTLQLASLLNVESIDFGDGNDAFLIRTGMNFAGMVVDMGAGTDYLMAQNGDTLDISAYTLGVEFLNLEYITDNTAAETVIGTNQADDIRMQADTAADTFSGMGGDDIFRFTGAVNRNDNIDGGDGNDQILGASGNDTLQLASLSNVESIDFGDGNDAFLLRAGMNFAGMVVDMGAGTDYLMAQSGDTLDISAYTLGVEFLNLEYITDNTGAETVIGTNQGDEIHMQSDYAIDTFSGMGGNDIFMFTGFVSANDHIDGGDGEDQIIGSSGNDTLQLASLINVESINFGDGDDAFIVRAGLTPGDMFIDMGAGTDYIMAQTNNTLDIAAYTLGVDLLGLEYITDNTGAETIIGTNQDDKIHIRSDLYGDAFYGLDGDDTFIFSGSVNRGDIINGGNGYDRLLGSDGDDVLLLNGLVSIEFIDLGAGTNYIASNSGGALNLSAYTIGVNLLGLEYITDNTRGETVTGTSQSDEIRIKDDLYKDFIRGMDGDDTLVLEGNLNQNDDLDGGAGYDRLIGTDGDNGLVLSRLANIEYIDLGAGTDYFRANSGGTLNLSVYTVGTTLFGLEYIIDNTNAETVTGTNQSDEIHMVSDLYVDTFNGLDGDDTFIFSGDLNQNDNINGGAGYDRIIASAGNDSLMLNTMSSIEYIDMGAGTDYIRARSGGTLDISAYTVGTTLLGLEYIIDNTNAETVTGTNQSDEIHMVSDLYADTFNGLDGDDTFIFSGDLNQNDNINGGAGYDRIIASAGNDSLTLNTMSSIEYIDMGAGTDYIRARVGGTLDMSAYTVGVDLLGLEYIIDNTGAEILIGTNQSDEIRITEDLSTDSFNGQDGDDTFRFSGNINQNDSIDGGDGYDRIIGSSGSDSLTLSSMVNIEYIDMGAGTDYIRARSGGTLDMSAYTVGVDLLGLEYIIDHTGTETVTGTNQGDEIRMQSDTYADTFNGLDGDDTFKFSGSVNRSDIINGGDGNDIVLGSSGNDTLLLASFSGIEAFDFGDGNDAFLIRSGMDFTGVVVDMGAGTDYLMAQSGNTLDISAYTLGVEFLNLEYITDNTSTETVIGTHQNDEIHMRADTYADTFSGLDGDDSFVVSGAVNGGDIIDGGNGTNVVIGSAGNDTLRFASFANIASFDFGDGNDAFLIRAGMDFTGVVVDMGAGTDYLMAQSGNTLDISAYTLGVEFLNLEYITDNTNTETVIGTHQNDEIHMRADVYADTFSGLDGDDTFVVSGAVNGGDIIDGGNGTNVVIGSAGNDTLRLASFANIASFDFGDGDDVFQIRAGMDFTGVVVDMGAGTDYLMAQSGNTLDISAYTLGVEFLNLEYITDNTGAETVIGTNQNDEIHMRVDIYADTFSGMDGDDTFVLNGAVNYNDVVHGGNGNDTVFGSSGNDTLSLASFSGIEAFDFGDGNDAFLIRAGMDFTGVVVDMGAGTDYLMAQSGNTLDISAYTLGVEFLNLEFITDNTGAETVIGTHQNDEIHIQSDLLADTFSGLDGDDTFVVSGAVNGGDVINGGSGTNVVIGSAGNDTLRLASFANIASFDFGNGDDAFLIRAGMDFTGVVVDMGAGTDYLMAQSGNTLDISAYTLGVEFLNLEYITDNTGTETVTGTNQNDQIYIQADAFVDTFNGMDGDDTFVFSGVINGADIINGGNGNDSLIGSSENDSLVWGTITSIELIDMGAGTDYMMAQSGGTLDLSGYTIGVNLLGLEYITDNIGSETVIGTAQNNLIHLQSDNNTDVLYGGAGADTFYIGGVLNAIDTLADYSAAQGDVINIADVLSYDSDLGHLINDFIRLTDSGDGNPSNGSGSVTLEVDIDGALNGSVFQSYVVFNDQGVDLATLISNASILIE